MNREQLECEYEMKFLEWMAPQPSDSESSRYCARFNRLCRKLERAGLIDSPKLSSVNKLLNFLATEVGWTEGENFTRKQWDDFFACTESRTKKRGGLVSLVRAVNEANGGNDGN
jgi:hypothetical protein